MDLNPSKYTYEEIVSQHKSHYRSLLVKVLWNGEQDKGETESPDILVLREELESLKKLVKKNKVTNEK